MALGARAALNCQPRRLVDGNYLRVAVDHQLLDFGRVAVRDRRPFLGLAWRRGGDAGWQADGLARLDPVPAFDPLAVQPDLAGAQELLKRAVAELGKMPLEPAVQPQARLVARYGARLDLTPNPAHAAHPTGQGKKRLWNRCRSTR